MTSATRLRAVVLLGFMVGAGADCAGQTSTGAGPGSIKWYAEQAKQNGESSVTVHGPQGMHEKITSLDQALSTYHVIVGIPVDSLSELIDSFHIYTWYKIRIAETLIVHPNPEVAGVSIPSSLKPLKRNEIVIRIPEGTVRVDGVAVTVTDDEVHLLTLSSKYLLFLSPDSSGQFAYLRSGVNSVFTVTGDNKIMPLVAKPESRMQEDLQASTGGALDQLRSFAKAKASERPPNN